MLISPAFWPYFEVRLPWGLQAESNEIHGCFEVFEAARDHLRVRTK
jgi:hypothetical protein